MVPLLIRNAIPWKPADLSIHRSVMTLLVIAHCSFVSQGRRVPGGISPSQCQQQECLTLGVLRERLPTRNPRLLP